MSYDVAIIGGGPAGLSAALALGRMRRRVFLCDSGPRRNARAVEIHNFVTRDGTPPEEFRRIARAELEAYPNVTVRDVQIDRIAGSQGSFALTSGEETLRARRILLCAGMVDEMLPIEGFKELWGHAIFQCPYCHGWEVKERTWGYLLRAENLGHFLPFVLQLRGLARDVCVFQEAEFELPAEAVATLRGAGVRIFESPVLRLVGKDEQLEAVLLADGTRVPCEIFYAHPPQKQVSLVASLGLELDENGFVRVDPMTRETSRPGIYAAGDLTTRMQGAIIAAASAMQASAVLNVDVTAELLREGALPTDTGDR